MYDGKKFFSKGEQTYYNVLNQKCVKPIFLMTRSYSKYLKEKQEAKERQEMLALKHKLDYQYRIEGQVDEIDFNRYVLMLSKA